MNLLGNDALDVWCAATLGAPGARVTRAEKLSGGAIQENWALDVTTGGDVVACVLRRDAPAVIAASRTRAQEYALTTAAWDAGVRVPRPLGFCADAGVIGAPFALMARVKGTAYGPKVVRDTTLAHDRAALGRDLGAQLARIHAVPVEGLREILGDPPADPARAAVATCRDWLDALGADRPGLEWGLRWAERHAPAPGPVTLTHQDFRTGNLMLDEGGLTAILDWEFAALSDPMADLGWFCAKCWRFSRPDLEGGGLVARADLYDGYTQAGGTLDPARIAWWEVMAHLRWAVIAQQQGARHDTGAEPSLHLALTGRIADVLEHEVLGMTA